MSDLLWTEEQVKEIVAQAAADKKAAYRAGIEAAAKHVGLCGLWELAADILALPDQEEKK